MTRVTSKAAVQEEMSHYLLEESIRRKPTAFTTFYYPTEDVHRCADDPQHLGDAGGRVHRRLSGWCAPNSARRICGSPPRESWGLSPITARSRASLARTWRIGDGGPIEQDRRDSNSANRSIPPNNNGYERTLGLTSISQAVEALEPFAVKGRLPKRLASTCQSHMRSCRSRPPCQARWVNSTR